MLIAAISDTHLPRGRRRIPDACLERLAAADLILHEAGALLTDFAGTPPAYNKPQPSHGEMIAVASQLHPRAIEAMRT